MTKLGAFKPVEIRDILVRAGYEIVRQNGSHISLRRDGRPAITMALHSKEVSPGLARKILIKDAGLTEDEIQELR